ncbi:MAG: phytoene desaturase family protein [Ornithinimicrobium sp.]
MSKIVIIGAGLAGLSAACHLSRTGHQVTVVESRSQVGGLAGEQRQDGHVFDLGPTVLTMPDLIESTLQAAGGSLDLLPMTQLDPAYRAFFADGSQMDIWSDHATMRDQIARMSGPEDAKAFDEFVPWLKRLYDVEMPHFIDRNFDSPLGLVNRPRPAAGLVRMGAFGNLSSLVAKRFTDERLHRLFTFQALYAGLAPHEARGIYAVISYMDAINGVFFPDEGMHALPRAMATAAQDSGVTIRLDTPVTVLPRDGSGRVTGVVLGDEYLAADAVVCTTDVSTAYATLLSDVKTPLSLRRPRYSPSAVVWHIGTTDASADHLLHHNIHFGHEWERSFDQLIGEGTLMSDPSRLVTLPTVTAPDRAPEGGSTMFVLEPVPDLTGKIDWQQQREPMRERLLQFLERGGYPTDIRTEQLVTPADWADQGLASGTPFSLSHLFRQTGPFRPRNAPRNIPGLFFAGMGTTPGVGVPMVLISGNLAAQRVVSYLDAKAA